MNAPNVPSDAALRVAVEAIGVEAAQLAVRLVATTAAYRAVADAIDDLHVDVWEDTCGCDTPAHETIRASLSAGDPIYALLAVLGEQLQSICGDHGWGRRVLGAVQPDEATDALVGRLAALTAVVGR